MIDPAFHTGQLNSLNESERLLRWRWLQTDKDQQGEWRKVTHGFVLIAGKRWVDVLTNRLIGPAEPPWR